MWVLVLVRGVGFSRSYGSWSVDPRPEGGQRLNHDTGYWEHVGAGVLGKTLSGLVSLVGRRTVSDQTGSPMMRVM